MSRFTPALLLPILALCLPTPAKADRGVWFWASTTLPSGAASTHGSDDIVGLSTGPLENAAISFMTGCGVTRLYGSYKNRPFSEPEEIRPWNAKLSAAGIQSQLLISAFEPADDDDLTDTDHLVLVGKVYKRLVLFNDVATAAEQFQALHLDLEPQKLTVWDSGDAASRRVLLDHLLDAYIDIRAELDSNGYSWVSIYADIPPTWDKMPLPDPADGKVGWTSTTDRDNWFAAIDAVLDGVSLMTFNKDNFPDIDTITSYERDPINFSGEARVAIQPKTGPSEQWLTYTDFLNVLTALETNYGKADLENYAFWKHFKPTVTTATFSADIGVGVGGPVVIFTGVPGHVYTIKQSSKLDGKWQDLAEMTVQGTGPREIRFPVELAGPRRFWKVEESAEAPR